MMLLLPSVLQLSSCVEGPAREKPHTYTDSESLICVHLCHLWLSVK
jgi:hypothetical protein